MNSTTRRKEPEAPSPKETSEAFDEYINQLVAKEVEATARRMFEEAQKPESAT